MLKFFISLALIIFVSWQNEGYTSLIKELEDGSVTIKSAQKYPPHVFDTLAFIKDVREKLSKHDTNTSLSIDLSGDISVHSRDIELILNELEDDSVVRLLNVSGTSIEANVIALLSKSRIECINISETDAAESEELSFEEPCEKFIFIPESSLYLIDGLHKDTLSFHKKYYGHNDEKNLLHGDLIQGEKAKKAPSFLGTSIPPSRQLHGSSSNCGNSAQGLTLSFNAQIPGLTG